MDNIKDNEIFNLAFEEILHYNISDINPNDIVKSHVSKKEALNHYRHHDTIFTFYYKHAEDDYTIIELWGEKMNAEKYLEYLNNKRKMKEMMWDTTILISIISIVFISILLLCIGLILVFVDVSVVLVDKNIGLHKLFLSNSIFGGILGAIIIFVAIEFLKSNSLKCIKHAFKAYKEFKEE